MILLANILFILFIGGCVILVVLAFIPSDKPNVHVIDCDIMEDETHWKVFKELYNIEHRNQITGSGYGYDGNGEMIDCEYYTKQTFLGELLE